MNTTNFPSGEDYILNRSIMIVGAHADDNEIHCGGTALKYHDRGYDIIYVQSTNNMSGGVSTLHPDGKVTHDQSEGPVLMMQRRKRECAAAAAVLGAKPIHLDHPQRHYNGPGGKQVKLVYGTPLPEGVPANAPSILTAHENDAAVKRLTDLIVQTAPEVVFTHGVAQVNVEHFTTCLLVTNAYWKAVDAGFKGALLHWREAHLGLGELNARWDTFVDYSPYLDRKMALIGKHVCQMPKAHLEEFGHRRLAKWWGSACGCIAAEVFTWVNRGRHRNDTGPIVPDLSLELQQNSR
jgi:LmbE family N-acetylglucosaminyl deacetylase